MGRMTTRTLSTALVLSLALNLLLAVQLWARPAMPNNGADAAPTASTTADRTRDVTYESGKQYPFMRVVDGDTIVVGFNNTTEYVRLIGIDTPEMNDPGGPQCYAEEATAHLRDLLTTGTVVLQFDPSQGMRDMYGRLLAYVELPDGTDANRQMLEDGYALEYTYAKPYARVAGYKAAQEDAMTAERGLWDKNACATK